jgi:DUF971 family protein
MALPKKIILNEQKSLRIEWDNGKIVDYPLNLLRDESPDARNKGETILWKHYAPEPQGPELPGKYEVDNIEKVGNYAIKITWKDGYDYGIYSWDTLERLGDYLNIKNQVNKEKINKNKEG